MQKRKLGRSNLEVSAISFGCMGLNFAYTNTLERKDAMPLVQESVTHGVSFLNTAEAYDPFSIGSGYKGKNNMATKGNR
jgi:aryl-alcohol dehydrogenase-like predicted oxidoreductase